MLLFQNGATCVDGINDYVCKCSGDYSGKFCEITPLVAMLYPQTSPCQHHDCVHGVCFQPSGSNDYLCKCAPGYSGKLVPLEKNQISTMNIFQVNAVSTLPVSALFTTLLMWSWSL